MLTPNCTVLLEKLKGSRLVKKFRAFYGTRRFITAFTSARHLSLSWAGSIQSTPPHSTCCRTILILSSHLRLELRSYQSISVFCNKARFYGEELLAHRPTPKLEDHSLSAVRYCLFNIFTATLHIACRSSIRNLKTRHAVLTGTHLSRGLMNMIYKIYFSFLSR
jgi:hypothetical protein